MENQDKIWSHPLLCIRTSTVISNLYHLFGSSLSKFSSSIRSTAKTRLWKAKLLYYFLCMQLTLRAIHFTLTLDMNNESDLIANLHINPLGVIVVGQFCFINTLIAVSTILVLFWILFLDYLFTYKMNELFLDSAYQMFVSNGPSSTDVDTGQVTSEIDGKI